MALLVRIYFNAVFGALGGLLGWMLFGVFGDKNVTDERLTAQILLGGALIGGVIGYFVVSVEAIRDRSLSASPAWPPTASSSAPSAAPWACWSATGSII